jgi:pyruvate, water dikinase
MSIQKGAIDGIIHSLGERAKELNCLYTLEELLNTRENSLDTIFNGIVSAIPAAWQYPNICMARLEFDGTSYESEGLKRTEWMQSSPIILQESGERIVHGVIEIYYLEEVPQSDEGPFLKDERKLLNTISDRLGHHITHRMLRGVYNEWSSAREQLKDSKKADWSVVLEMIRITDKQLYTRVSRKMLNHLCWSGIDEADKLLKQFSFNLSENDLDLVFDSNKPIHKEKLNRFIIDSDDIFDIAAKHLSEEEILLYIQKWIQDDKSIFLIDVLEDTDSSLADIIDAIGRASHIAPHGAVFSDSTRMQIRVSLINRFFTEQLNYINVAKNYIEIEDFYDLVKRVVYHAKSRGRVGGKSAGLFLASQILKRASSDPELFSNVKVPKTWYITSDCVLDFIHFNNLEDVFSHKYKEIDHIRDEYPHLVQMFKNSHFSPDIIRGLSTALDDFGDKPLIVRSSSLLEDSLGAAFSGKYKSLFIANRGTKNERLAALMDAIAEVYASTFSPDPIGYRAERALLDFREEMGIMIQEVVGKQVGKYFMPAFAGVAFSSNEFRWSPRIKREDGLLRMVPGLGTRAVDRTSDDYPILMAPGQPGLRINLSVDEIIRYSPKQIDVINTETNGFETVDIHELLAECGDEYPMINQIISLYEGDHIRQPIGFDTDFKESNFAVTFEGLISGTKFIKQMDTMLKLIQDTLQTPVDLEFASDGTDLYLLQCRPQSFSSDSGPSPIPKNLPLDEILFSANKHISNGKMPEITHLVYVDPGAYAELPTRQNLLEVGRAVSKLNKLLPKRQFILMGPGRWGSRGDIKLGVNVTYSDINNTAALVEIARKKGSYVPDLSFGTHFFQDLVEASIRYLPLYPDDTGIMFNESFFLEQTNYFKQLVPEFAYLENTIRVIDVPKVCNGKVVHVNMNADEGQALGFLADPSDEKYVETGIHDFVSEQKEDHWTWRLKMAERIASQLSASRFGVTAMYVFGSTKNATARSESDIDLLVHFAGTEKQKTELQAWFEGWSLSLGEMNYLHTGKRLQSILDTHYISDEDIAKKDSYAFRINNVTDPARPLLIGE